MDNDEWEEHCRRVLLIPELTPEEKRYAADMFKAPPMRAGGGKNTRKEWAQFFGVEREKVPPMRAESCPAAVHKTALDRAREQFLKRQARAEHCRQPPGYKPINFELEWQAAKQRLADAFAVPPEVLRGQPGRVGVDFEVQWQRDTAVIRTGLPLVALRKLCPSPQPECEVGFGSEPPAKPAPEPLPKGATRHPAIGAQCFTLPDTRAFMLGRDV